jgi:hypothetical protein
MPQPAPMSDCGSLLRSYDLKRVYEYLGIVMVAMLWGCGACRVLNPFLNAAVDAPDQAAFNKALRAHGPIVSGEVSGLATVMLHDKVPHRRANAARLLTAARDGDTEARAGIRKTSDLAVWAILVNSQLGLRPQLKSEAPDRSLAAAQPHMIREALVSKVPEILKAGLIAGKVAVTDGISAAGLAHVTHADLEIQAAAAAAIDERDYAAHVAELTTALDTLRSGDALRILLGGLVKTGDPRVSPAALRMLARLRKSDNGLYLSLLNGIGLSDKPNEQMEAFLFDVASADDEVRDFGLSTLVTKVGWGGRTPGPRLVNLCIGIIERGYLGNERKGRINLTSDQQACEQMFYFMKTGRNPVSDEHQWRIESDGPKAIASARAWLAEHPSSTTKALE